MNVCVECGKIQKRGSSCHHCGCETILPVAFVRDVFGPNWRQMFVNTDIKPIMPKKVRTIIKLPDGEFSTTWQATGVQGGCV